MRVEIRVVLIIAIEAHLSTISASMNQRLDAETKAAEMSKNESFAFHSLQMVRENEENE